MALSRLAEECQACPFVDKCKNKRIECLGYLPDPVLAPLTESSAESMVQPIFRETTTIIVDDKPTIVYKDEIEKALYKELYSHLGLNYATD